MPPGMLPLFLALLSRIVFVVPPPHVSLASTKVVPLLSVFTVICPSAATLLLSAFVDKLFCRCRFVCPEPFSSPFQLTVNFPTP